jgi:hemerythrin-like metal-binding protein
MKKFELTENYLIGIAEIDNKHKDLVRILNSMLDLQEIVNLEACANKCGEFVEELRRHFVTEENIMEIHNYSNISMHKISHGDTLEKMLNLRGNCGRECKGIQCVHDITSIFVFDLLREDLDFKEYLYAHGHGA